MVQGKASEATDFDATTRAQRVSHSAKNLGYGYLGILPGEIGEALRQLRDEF